MSWVALMALGATIVIAGGGIDISVGSIFGLAALGTAAVLQGLDENASAWLVLPVAGVVALGIGLVCGLINGAIVVGLRMHPFIVTLGDVEHLPRPGADLGADQVPADERPVAAAGTYQPLCGLAARA